MKAQAKAELRPDERDAKLGYGGICSPPFMTFKIVNMKRQGLATTVEELRILADELEGTKCEFCNKAAEHRHHTTEPMEVDEFLFLCESCHDKIHGTKRYTDCVEGENK